jgi:hypothetical protein
MPISLPSTGTGVNAMALFLDVDAVESLAVCCC